MTADTDALLESPTMRCADAARVRGEQVAASAVRYHRFLLLEAPGPWGKSALDDKHMGPVVAGQLARAAAATGTHVLLIRRPGRHPAPGPGTGRRVMAWAFADTSPGAERVLWGAWRDPADLLNLDLTTIIPGEANAAASQRLALVCTNGKRDQCCALRGRPVAAALAEAGWDTWECSHLGGHRFAATLLVLPTGDMFGWLDAASAIDVLRRFDAGQLDLSHHRGRAGQPAHVQAALHAAAVRLGDFGRAAFTVAAARPVPAELDSGWYWRRRRHRALAGRGHPPHRAQPGNRLPRDRGGISARAELPVLRRQQPEGRDPVRGALLHAHPIGTSNQAGIDGRPAFGVAAGFHMI